MTPFHFRDRLKGLLGRKPTEAETPARTAAVEPAVAPVSTPTPVAAAAPASTPASPTPPADDDETRSPDEEKQHRHWLRTRKGMLTWLVEHGGTATMADMHERSEKKFFVAHRGFSRLMEEFTEEGLVEYTATTGLVVLTDAGRVAHHAAKEAAAN